MKLQKLYQNIKIFLF